MVCPVDSKPVVLKVGASTPPGNLFKMHILRLHIRNSGGGSSHLYFSKSFGSSFKFETHCSKLSPPLNQQQTPFLKRCYRHKALVLERWKIAPQRYYLFLSLTSCFFLSQRKNKNKSVFLGILLSWRKSRKLEQYWNRKDSRNKNEISEGFQFSSLLLVKSVPLWHLTYTPSPRAHTGIRFSGS